jgi:hypothetical protein
VIGAPPRIEIFFIFPSAKNPSHSESGEKERTLCSFDHSDRLGVWSRQFAYDESPYSGPASRVREECAIAGDLEVASQDRPALDRQDEARELSLLRLYTPCVPCGHATDRGD